MIQKGNIHWYRFDHPVKKRPVLIIGSDEALPSWSRIPVIPFSTEIRGLKWEVVLEPEEGLFHRSTLKIEWITSVEQNSIGPFIANFPTIRWKELSTKLMIALGLDIYE